MYLRQISENNASITGLLKKAKDNNKYPKQNKEKMHNIRDSRHACATKIEILLIKNKNKNCL